MPSLKFSFAFEQFFPQGDDDLQFFEEFIDEFESDDNFLLIAIENDPDIFEPQFLKRVDKFKDSLTIMKYVTGVQSLTSFRYPVKTPFGISSVPALHLEDSIQLQKDKTRILSDDRFVYNLINGNGTAICLLVKTEDQLGMNESSELMTGIYELEKDFGKEKVHYLGRAYFQNELAWMQKREVIVSTFVGALLVFIIMMIIYRKLVPVIIAISSIGLGLLIFFGVLAALGRELNAIAAFYPVLMLIVGTSDIIHIMSKYIDEIKSGKTNEAAIDITIRQIGKATLLTSLTTAAGFLSLLTSRLIPIRDFGINSAIGVLIAFVCVILFSASVISLLPKEHFLSDKKGKEVWESILDRTRIFTIARKNLIFVSIFLFLGFCFFGMSKISTNYTIEGNLPKGVRITKDFKYFEKEFAGFRPLEFVLTVGDDNELNDYKVVKATENLVSFLGSMEEINAVSSYNVIYKSINQMLNGNKQSAYVIPGEASFSTISKYVERFPLPFTSKLVNKKEKKLRISARIKDLGADEIKEVGTRIDSWVQNEINPNLLQVRRTGTGLIMDKNAVYVRNNLIQGLLLALIVISILMGFLFRNIRMLFISIVPNVFPLLFAAAIMGYFGIELEAVLSIVFALIFGIAVDDSIHFLSKYKQSFEKTGDKEEALRITFKETGRAIVFTSIILFFGFLVMLFSIHPPSVIIGTLIAITLISALLADLIFLPMLIRKFL